MKLKILYNCTTEIELAQGIHIDRTYTCCPVLCSTSGECGYQSGTNLTHLWGFVYRDVILCTYAICLAISKVLKHSFYVAQQN